MKKFLIALVSAVLIITGCASTGASVPSTADTDAYKYRNQNLQDVDIEGKILAGENNGKHVKYAFNKDRTLVKTVDGVEYTGTWDFKSEYYPMLAFVLDWTEGEEKKGYMATIAKNAEDEYVIAGYWYLSDAYITLFETLKEEK